MTAKPRRTGLLGHSSSPATPQAKIIEIAPDDIVIPDDMRPVDEETVAQLTDSIDQIGLQAQGIVTIKWNPIDSTKRATLITGRQRLEAFRRKGWEMIPAVVFDGTAAEAELWRIYENLARKELTSLERSERIARAVTLVDEKRRSAQVAQSQHPNDKAISATSRALGIDRRRVQRSLRIAGLSDEAKTVATDLGLADNQRVLSNTAASAVTPEEQVDFLKQTAARLKLRPPRERSEQEKPAIENAKATSIENSRRLREQTHRAATFLLERLGEPDARELLEMVDNIGPLGLAAVMDRLRLLLRGRT
jgi:ParB-like chromosome segregation protein Spo0J